MTRLFSGDQPRLIPRRTRLLLFALLNMPTPDTVVVLELCVFKGKRQRREKKERDDAAERQRTDVNHRVDRVDRVDRVGGRWRSFRTAPLNGGGGGGGAKAAASFVAATRPENERSFNETRKFTGAGSSITPPS